MMLPLLAPRDLEAPLAWCAGVPVSSSRFLAEAATLAETLPHGRPVNLCQDRYRFALGLAAALLRGQTSLMPPNALPETLAQLADSSAPPYALVDDDGTPWRQASGAAMSRGASSGSALIRPSARGRRGSRGRWTPARTPGGASAATRSRRRRALPRPAA